MQHRCFCLFSEWENVSITQLIVKNPCTDLLPYLVWYKYKWVCVCVWGCVWISEQVCLGHKHLVYTHSISKHKKKQTSCPLRGYWWNCTNTLLYFILPVKMNKWSQVCSLASWSIYGFYTIRLCYRFFFICLFLLLLWIFFLRFFASTRIPATNNPTRSLSIKITESRKDMTTTGPKKKKLK